MRRKLSLVLVFVLAAGALLVGSTGTGQAAASWKVRAEGYAITSGFKSTMGASAHATADTRWDPKKVQVVIEWHSFSGRKATIEYSWYRMCWNQPKNRPRMQKDLVTAGRVDQWVTLADGATFRKTWRTNKDLCEVHVGGILNRPQAGRLTVRVRDLK
jgi:hypothetical protein